MNIDKTETQIVEAIQALFNQLREIQRTANSGNNIGQAFIDMNFPKTNKPGV